MSFLDGYEASRERLERWHRTYPNGRIETRIVEFSAEKGYVLVEAKAYRDADDLHPAGIDYAYGYQGAYQKNMARWFVEDTTTSAIMRVQQLVMGGAERSTREIMEQVENAPANVINSDPWATVKVAHDTGTTALTTAMAEIQGQLGGELVAEPARCAHGTMIWKQAAAGSPKNWGGYFCTEKTKATQCQPYWHVLASDGKWKPQV